MWLILHRVSGSAALFFKKEKEEFMPAIKKPRLRKLRSISAEVLAELAAIAADPEQTKSRRAQATHTRAELLMTLLNNDSHEVGARIRHNVDEPEPPKAVAEKPKETIEERLARLKGER
jgi:hypothetical protein